jgi:hypothetical protein
VVDRKMPRVQEVLFPVLREEFPGVTVSSWVPQVDSRVYPIINVRRLSGISGFPDRLELPVIELTVYSRDGLVPAEDLYLDARLVIFNMVENQTLTPAGYLHSYFETMGPIQLDSPFDDSWRIQGLIQLGVRPLRS